MTVSTTTATLTAMAHLKLLSLIHLRAMALPMMAKMMLRFLLWRSQMTSLRMRVMTTMVMTSTMMKTRMRRIQPLKKKRVLQVMIFSAAIRLAIVASPHGTWRHLLSVKVTLS